MAQLVARLTKDIVETYQTCNPLFKYSEELNPKRYLTTPSNGVLNDGCDNVNSDLILSVNYALINLETHQRFLISFFYIFSSECCNSYLLLEPIQMGNYDETSRHVCLWNGALLAGFLLFDKYFADTLSKMSLVMALLGRWQNVGLQKPKVLLL